MSAIGGALVAMGFFRTKSRPVYDVDHYLIEDKIELEQHYKDVDITPEEFNQKYDEFVKNCKNLHRSMYIKTLKLKRND